MTLQEVMKQIPKAEWTKRVPSVALLSEESCPVFRDEMDEETCATIYSNGFVLFQRGDYATVFPLHACGDYVYHTVEEDVQIPFSEFADQPWQVRVYMEGKDRLNHNLNNRQEGRALSINDDSDIEKKIELSDKGLYDPLRILLDRESVQEEGENLQNGWNSLTERQKEILTLCVLNGKTRAEAAAELGMSSQAVTDCVRHAIKQLRKQFGLTGFNTKRQYYYRWDKKDE